MGYQQLLWSGWPSLPMAALGLEIAGWEIGNQGVWAVISILLLSLFQIFGNYYHFRHSGVVKRSLSPHQPWHSRLAREPQVRAAGGPCLPSAGAWLWSWALYTGM